MTSGKDILKSHGLSWRQKVYSDWEDAAMGQGSCGDAGQSQLGDWSDPSLTGHDRWLTVICGSTGHVFHTRV